MAPKFVYIQWEKKSQSPRSETAEDEIDTICLCKICIRAQQDDHTSVFHKMAFILHLMTNDFSPVKSFYFIPYTVSTTMISECWPVVHWDVWLASVSKSVIIFYWCVSNPSVDTILGNGGLQGEGLTPPGIST